MKKVLSIILALTLAFSLLPTFASAETTETETEMNWDEPVVFELNKPTNMEFTANTYIEPGDAYYGKTWAAIPYKDYSGLMTSDSDKYGSNKQKTRIKMSSVSGTYHYLAIAPTTAYIEHKTNTFSFAVKIPESGVYDISADVFNSASGATAEAEIVEYTENAEANKRPELKSSVNIGTVENVNSDADDDGKAGQRNRVFTAGGGVPVAKTEYWKITDKPYYAGTHVKMRVSQNAGLTFGLYNLKFTPSTINSAAVTVPVTEYKVGDTFTPSVSLNVEGVGDKTYSDLDKAGIVLGVKEEDAGVAVANNVFTVTKESDVTFTPTVTVNGKTHEAAAITLDVASNEDEALKEAFKVEKETLTKYVAPSVVSVSAGGSVITPEKNTDGSYDIEASAVSKDGAKFLYWAKGLKANKKIVSFSNKLENYVPEEDGADWLIAVYDDMLPANDEYYNANGQLIATGEKPALPSMAGYGKASDWKQYGETNIYVAEYNGKTQPDSVEVTVNGETKTVPYGTEITCTATDANFKCWTKSNINGKTEIVSTENVYKFKAWEDCSVDVINEAYNYNGDTFKIVVDSFGAGNETGIMAEFIGFGNNVVEKGIMWESKKIAMTKPGSQFSVIADKNGEYKGYAIVGNATDGYTLITDGSVTVSTAK